MIETLLALFASMIMTTHGCLHKYVESILWNHNMLGKGSLHDVNQRWLSGNSRVSKCDYAVNPIFTSVGSQQ